MATKDLKDKYGEGNTKSIINRAIREEVTGGEGLLNLMESVYTSKLSANELMQHLAVIRIEMEAEIRRRYDMNPINPNESE